MTRKQKAVAIIVAVMGKHEGKPVPASKPVPSPKHGDNTKTDKK